MEVGAGLTLTPTPTLTLTLTLTLTPGTGAGPPGAAQPVQVVGSGGVGVGRAHHADRLPRVVRVAVRVLLVDAHEYGQALPHDAVERRVVQVLHAQARDIGQGSGRQEGRPSARATLGRQARSASAAAASPWCPCGAEATPLGMLRLRGCRSRQRTARRARAREQRRTCAARGVVPLERMAVASKKRGREADAPHRGRRAWGVYNKVGTVAQQRGALPADDSHTYTRESSLKSIASRI